MGSMGQDGHKTRLHGWDRPSPWRLFGSFWSEQKELAVETVDQNEL